MIWLSHLSSADKQRLMDIWKWKTGWQPISVATTMATGAQCDWHEASTCAPNWCHVVTRRISNDMQLTTTHLHFPHAICITITSFVNRGISSCMIHDISSGGAFDCRLVVRKQFQSIPVSTWPCIGTIDSPNFCLSLFWYGWVLVSAIFTLWKFEFEWLALVEVTDLPRSAFEHMCISFRRFG